MDETQKRCSKCRQLKPLEHFAWANKAKGYRESKCRYCRSLAHRRWYLANRDYKLMRNMQWYADNREKQIAAVTSRRGSRPGDGPAPAPRPRGSDAAP